MHWRVFNYKIDQKDLIIEGQVVKQKEVKAIDFADSANFIAAALPIPFVAPVIKIVLLFVHFIRYRF